MKHRLYDPAENVEILDASGKVYAIFRDKLETITRSGGRWYGPLTTASASRLIALMNSDKMELELKTDGKVVNVLAWRTHALRARLYKKDQWG